MIKVTYITEMGGNASITIKQYNQPAIGDTIGEAGGGLLEEYRGHLGRGAEGAPVEWPRVLFRKG